jgi:hypothetical protein
METSELWGDTQKLSLSFAGRSVNAIGSRPIHTILDLRYQVAQTMSQAFFVLFEASTSSI